MHRPYDCVDLGYRRLPSIYEITYERPLYILDCHNILQPLIQIGQFLLSELSFSKRLAILRAHFDQGMGGGSDQGLPFPL